MSSRERFEACFSHLDLTKYKDELGRDAYLDLHVDSRWQGWQANEPRWQDMEPVLWSVTCDGAHVGNVHHDKPAAERHMAELNQGHPHHVRKVVPLYAPPSNVTGD